MNEKYNKEACPNICLSAYAAIRGHKLKLCKNQCNTNIRKQFFTNRIVDKEVGMLRVTTVHITRFNKKAADV